MVEAMVTASRERSTLAPESYWSFLEGEPDPCCVLSHRMDVVYMNRTARVLTPRLWFGEPCRDVFGLGCEAAALGLDGLPRGDGVSVSAQTVFPREGEPMHAVLALAPFSFRGMSTRLGLLVIRPYDESLDPVPLERALARHVRLLRAAHCR